MQLCTDQRNAQVLVFIPLLTSASHVSGGPGSSVDIATDYGLEIESRWGRDFTHTPWPWGPPSLLYNGYRVFPGGKGGRGVVLTTHPLLAPRSRMGRAIPLLTL
jgi:hypothetical protein